jgi:hypothetical protein
MAPGLPIFGSGDVGWSPFSVQLYTKQVSLAMKEEYILDLLKGRTKNDI